MDKKLLARMIASIITLVNLILIKTGKINIELADNEIYEIASYIVVVVCWAWGFWKNNSFTPEAKKADEYMRELKGETAETEETDDEQ